MIQNHQYEQAVALIDFCERDLTTANVAKYFETHTAYFNTKERNAILLTALSLIQNG